MTGQGAGIGSRVKRLPSQDGHAKQLRFSDMFEHPPCRIVMGLKSGASGGVLHFCVGSSTPLHGSVILMLDLVQCACMCAEFDEHVFLDGVLLSECLVGRA